MARTTKNTTKKATPAEAKNTSLAIDKVTSERLQKFCDANNLTKKDYISVSLDYFDRTKVNIRGNEVFDLKSEIEELKNQHAKELTELTKMLSQKIDNVQTTVSSGTLTAIANLIQQQQQTINAQLQSQQETTIKMIQEQQESTQKAIEELKPKKKKWWFK